MLRLSVQPCSWPAGTATSPRQSDSLTGFSLAAEMARGASVPGSRASVQMPMAMPRRSFFKRRPTAALLLGFSIPWARSAHLQCPDPRPTDDYKAEAGGWGFARRPWTSSPVLLQKAGGSAASPKLRDAPLTT